MDKITNRCNNSISNAPNSMGLTMESLISNPNFGYLFLAIWKCRLERNLLILTWNLWISLRNSFEFNEIWGFQLIWISYFQISLKTKFKTTFKIMEFSMQFNHSYWKWNFAIKVIEMRRFGNVLFESGTSWYIMVHYHV